MSSREKNLVIVRSVLDQGLTVAQAAARFGVTRQWVHVLIRRYEADGAQGVAPRSTAPKSRPGTTSEAVRERIVQLRRQLHAAGADAGPETIAWHLQQEGARAPSTSTIRRILHAQGLVVPEPRKRPKSSYIRFEADLPNGCWQADITHCFLADGTRVEVLDFLDDHSRYLLHVRAAPAYSGPMVVAALQELIDTHGVPASTLTDNGLVFTARLAGRKGGRNGFEKLLQAHHIHQKNGHPGQTNSPAGTTTNAPTAPSADAPQRPPTPPWKKPLPPHPPRTPSGAPASTRSAPPAPCHCVTPANYATSASAEPTPASPC